MDDIGPELYAERYVVLKRFVNLDLMRLDEELSEISVLLHEAGELTVMANDTRDSKKLNLARIESQVGFQLRRQIEAEEGKPPAETRIARMLPDEPSIVDAQSELSQAELDANLWRNLQDALRTKSLSIRAATDLISAGYLSADQITSKRHREMRQPRTEQSA
jgi:hypothetical protein